MRPAIARRPKALLLDDDPAVLRLLGRMLSARGVEVVAATEGEGGLELLLDELLDLDVLIVDLDLPGRDARSMLRLIRGAGGEEDLRVVVLADRPGAAVRTRLLALGADAVVDRAEGPEEAVRVAVATAARRRLDPTAARVEPQGASPRRPRRPSLLALPAFASASAAPA
ncbi:MAG TPA: response regulator [Anaeromyxobacteraceae bacterium]|nr:response regulator [Anaeromyxobacteraceae bacterium]